MCEGVGLWWWVGGGVGLGWWVGGDVAVAIVGCGCGAKEGEMRVRRGLVRAMMMGVAIMGAVVVSRCWVRAWVRKRDEEKWWQ